MSDTFSYQMSHVMIFLFELQNEKKQTYNIEKCTKTRQVDWFSLTKNNHIGKKDYTMLVINHYNTN